MLAHTTLERDNECPVLLSEMRSGERPVQFSHDNAELQTRVKFPVFPGKLGKDGCRHYFVPANEILALCRVFAIIRNIVGIL